MATKLIRNVRFFTDTRSIHQLLLQWYEQAAP
jgi:hypothetical protein